MVEEEEGAMKAHGWMGRTIHLMTSGTMNRVFKKIVLPGSIQKTFLKQAIAALEKSEANIAI